MIDVDAVANRSRTPTTVAVVIRWYIPGGYGYNHARVIKVFFDSMEEAEAYQKRYNFRVLLEPISLYPPEMADLLTIQKYDLLIARTSSNYSEYKKRYYKDFKSGE